MDQQVTRNQFKYFQITETSEIHITYLDDKNLVLQWLLCVSLYRMY